MKAYLLFAVALVEFLAANFVNKEQCFCPVDIDTSTRIFNSPSTFASFVTVSSLSKHLIGQKHGDWILIQGQKEGYVQAYQFEACQCVPFSNGHSFESSGRLDRTAAPALWNSWSDWTCSTTCGAGLSMRLRVCLAGGILVETSLCKGEDMEFHTCSKFQECDTAQWSNWDEWTCSISCGLNGVSVRRRECQVGAVPVDKSNCAGQAYEFTKCIGLLQCPDWSAWSEWLCTATCGTDNANVRRRECQVNGVPVDVSRCSGHFVDLGKCNNLPVCPHWTEWHSWEECSKSCGGGLQPRYRQCTDENQLLHTSSCAIDNPRASYQIQNCNTDPCRCTDWGNWNQCDLTCGTGVQTRGRDCKVTASLDSDSNHNYTENDTDNRSCSTNKCPIDGQFSAWSNWTECSVTCDGGRQDRSRHCDNPVPDFGGQNCVGNEHEQRQCADEVCPRDGGWSGWNDWSPCSATCNSGILIRLRQCDNPTPLGKGLNCSGDLHDIKPCLLQPCTVDGGWSDWTPWSACSCANQMSRRRECNNPAPVGGDQDCIGEGEQYSACTHTAHDCPVDGQWSGWIPWGSCNVTCGNGVEQRFRTCTNPKPSNGGNYCNGDFSSSRDCQENPCPVNGGWSDWSAWGPCSFTCENGTYVRNRSCSQPAPAFGGVDCIGINVDINDCFTNRKCPIDGDWTDWSAWSDCSVTCDNGTITRTRNCSNPEPKYGGMICRGSATEASICSLVNCPVDGDWSAWDAWSPCSTTCDGGTHSRLRTCTHPVPAYGGHNCSGPELENKFCYMQSCKINGSWGTWEVWTQCSLSCSNGTRERIRICDNPPPSNGGSNCNGTFRDTESCYRPCPVPCEDDPTGQCHDPDVLDFVCRHNETAEKYCKRSCGLCPKVNGEWSDWGSWSSCSVTCENGTQMRNRTCDRPAPAYGGDNCVGDDNAIKGCYLNKACPVPCNDDPNVNCVNPGVQGFICAHNDTAERYCKRSCGLCQNTAGVSG